MLLVFPISRHLEEKSLEGMAIIVCVRWMLFVPIAFGMAMAISIGIPSPDREVEPDSADYFLPLACVIYLSLLVRDVWLVRRVAVSWKESRIRTLRIMQRLPALERPQVQFVTGVH